MAEAAAATSVPAPAKGGSTKLLLIILIVLVLVGMGGAAAWFFLGGGSHAAASAPPKPKEPFFVPMETLTVNLQPEEGNDRYLQIAITFKSYDKHAEEAIKSYTPELRSRVLMLLSSKAPAELYSNEGKASWPRKSSNSANRPTKRSARSRRWRMSCSPTL
uniref:Flagellar protein FliL n=1 Tax=blood disease bacterium R229 TaxID=741978 RepID=G2ZRH5_9RALS